MATVWAYRVGLWSKKPESGWSHTIQMEGLSDLMESMSRVGLQGAVTHLAIVAHGDQPGIVQLDRLLTVGTIAGFSADFKGLQGYLTRDAMLTFFSCIAGKDKRGSHLLIEISRQLPGRTIVGFEVFGLIGAPGYTNPPGQMAGTEMSLVEVAMKPGPQLGRLDPWCPFAKRVRDGRILHLPLFEQNRHPRKTCANPACPGHSNPRHSCPGW
jgi:hypothetical protein